MRQKATIFFFPFFLKEYQQSNETMTDEECGCVGMTLESRVDWFNEQIKKNFAHEPRLHFDGSTPETDEHKGWFNDPVIATSCCNTEKNWTFQVKLYVDGLLKFINETRSMVTCSDFVLTHYTAEEMHWSAPIYNVFYTLTEHNDSGSKKF